MKITVNNIKEQYPKLNFKLPKELNDDEFIFIEDCLDLYKKDDTITKYIDTFIARLNEVLANSETEKKGESANAKKPSNGGKERIPKFLKDLISDKQIKEIEKNGIDENTITSFELIFLKLPTDHKLIVWWDLYCQTAKKRTTFGNWANVYLHFSNKNTDWFILSKIEDKPNVFECFATRKSKKGEKSLTISIQELHRQGAELDLHFKPILLSEALYLQDRQTRIEPMLLDKEKRKSIKIPQDLKKFINPIDLKRLPDYKYAKEIINRLEKTIKLTEKTEFSEKQKESFQEQFPNVDPCHFLPALLHYTWKQCEYYIYAWDRENDDVEMVILDTTDNEKMYHTGKLEWIVGQKSIIDFFWKPKSIQEALHEKAPDKFEKPIIRDIQELLTNNTSKKTKPTKNKKTSAHQANSSNGTVEKVEKIEHFSLEEKYIKRYLLLHNKVKTKGQILTFIKSLQKSIIDKQIAKTSKYAKQIEAVQTNLIKLYNTDTEDSFTVLLDDKIIAELKKIVGAKKVRLSVTYIKRFIGFFGQQTKEKAERLLDLIVKALKNGTITKSDPYYTRIKSTEKSLREYLDNMDITITTSELRGLADSVGLVAPKVSPSRKIKDSDFITSSELMKMNFPTMGFKGEWKKIMGDPDAVFHTMIYGEGGKGKSTLAVKFAKYLCEDLGLRVLYIADEEKAGRKIKNKLKIFNIDSDNLVIVGEIPKSLKGFDVVFFDSVTTIGISAKEMKELQKKNEGVSTIFIMQVNKKGEFHGEQKWGHNCDIQMRFEDGLITVEKNRFGEIGSHKMNLSKYYKVQFNS